MAALPLIVAAQSACSDFFRNTHNAYPHNEARASGPYFIFERGPELESVSYKPAGDWRSFTLEEYPGKFCTTGFIVLHEDRIVYERYLQGFGPQDSLHSASMSKTILALLVGIAIEDGKLTLDTRVREILTDFETSAFAEVTVEELLRMTAGVALREGYTAGSVSDNRATDPVVSPSRDTRAYLKAKTERSERGKSFSYNGAVTALLGLMLSQRTGVSNTRYLEEKIWSRIGAEASGFWIKNALDQEGVQGYFGARLRDYARLGLLVMHRGSLNGHQIVPAAWIDAMTTLRRDKPQPPGAAYYGLHVWIPEAAGGRSFFWGYGGQNIFVDPVARVVIVHTGNFPGAMFPGNSHLFPLRDAIVKRLSAGPDK